MLCIKCNLEKELKSFQPKRRQCKACRNQYRTEWRAINGRREKPKPKKNKSPKDTSLNKEKRNKYMREYYKINSDIIKIRTEKWRKNNLEKSRIAHLNWKKSNPEKAKIIRSRTKAKRRCAIGTYSVSDIKKIYVSQSGLCRYCQVKLKEDYQIDHIMPIKLGGTNWPDNLQILCRICNSKKGALHPSEFLKRMEAA